MAQVLVYTAWERTRREPYGGPNGYVDYFDEIGTFYDDVTHAVSTTRTADARTAYCDRDSQVDCDQPPENTEVSGNSAGDVLFAGCQPDGTYTTVTYLGAGQFDTQYSYNDDRCVVQPPADGVLGCTALNALNYNATATQDTTPTSCVFVQVVTPPDQLVAAHLPIPVVLRASPTLDGQPAIVVLRLDTAPSLSGPWVEFAQAKDVCDDTATVRFNLSEAAKSLLRIQPPVESGADPNLSALLRVRYEVLDPETLEPTYTGQVGICRALNAVIRPISGAVLTTAIPYPNVPTSGALWTTKATYAAGVTATPAALNATDCTARQFVWLNRKGVWDSAFFYGRHVHGTDQQDPISFRDAAGSDRYASKGNVRATLQVYSDLIDWPTYMAIRFIRRSIQVYERQAAGMYVPVLINVESFPEYTEQTDKTFQVNFTVSYPAQLIQTQ